MQEELGYIEGGSQTLVDALVTTIERLGGTIRLGRPASRVVTEGGRVVGVEAGGETMSCDAVISTVPTPLVSTLVPDLPPDWRAAYDGILNIGVTCIVLKLRRSVTPHFWVNVVDPEMPIPGIIEFSNLRPAGQEEAVVYVPYYMPVDHPRWAREDQVFIDEALNCLSRINPAVQPEDLIAAQVGRLRHAQPVCPPGFLESIPAVQTPIAGLQVADTCFYYPEDRGIAESVRLGRTMAEAVPVADGSHV